MKFYFVWTESIVPSYTNEAYILENRTIQEARSLFMHIHMTPSMAKYASRLVFWLVNIIYLVNHTIFVTGWKLQVFTDFVEDYKASSGSWFSAYRSDWRHPLLCMLLLLRITSNQILQLFFGLLLLCLSCRIKMAVMFTKMENV